MRKTFRKSKKNIRRSKKKIRKSNKKTRRSKKNFIGGGDWINYRDNILENQPTCPICTDSFGDNPNKAIYITNCKHLFHNDCLLELCDHTNGEAVCPICRADLDMACTDVWAFKNKVLGNMDGSHIFAGDNDILNIYDTQPDS